MIDIIIPVYNEADNIHQTLLQISQNVSVPYQLHLVYDSEKDNTLPAAKESAKQLNIKLNLIKNQFGHGALNAIKTGFSVTHSDYVVVTMADLSDPPQVINSMYHAATKHKFDLVCGSRYMPGGSQTGGPLLKRTLSKWAGLSLYFLTNLPTHDATNSFKLYKRSVLNAFPIESTGGFELGLEIVVKAKKFGFKIGEIPTSWQDRSAGKSRFKLFQWLPKYLRWYFYAFF